MEGKGVKAFLERIWLPCKQCLVYSVQHFMVRKNTNGASWLQTNLTSRSSSLLTIIWPEKSSSLSLLMLSTGKVLVRGPWVWWEPCGKQKVQSSEGTSCGENPVGGNQVQHNYSLICLSPPSASDVHSERHSTFHLGGKDFLLYLLKLWEFYILSCFLSLF